MRFLWYYLLADNELCNLYVALIFKNNCWFLANEKTVRKYNV